MYNGYVLISCFTDADKPTQKALDELADLYSYLRVWRIEKHVFIDALMPPTESYHTDLFFQVTELHIFLFLPLIESIRHLVSLSKKMVNFIGLFPRILQLFGEEKGKSQT